MRRPSDRPNRSRCAQMVLLTVLAIAIAPGSALAHSGQGNATPSNASGHPWAADGCTLSPDSWSNLYNFKHACDHHDGCYLGFAPRGGKAVYWVSKDQCDRWFLDDMNATCREMHPPRSRYLPYSNRDACLDIARGYYNAVQALGAGWYKRSPSTPLSTPTPPPPPPPAPGSPPPAPPPAPTPPPPPSSPAQPRGFHIEDSFLGGTWARTDPNDGTWYSQGNRPANGAYWYPNGLGVGVDCARAAAGYVVKWADGHTETWNTWFHVTDGKWYPSAATTEVFANGFYDLPSC